MSEPQTTQWPVHPQPREGEVLSSWLVRIAERYGLSLSEFRKGNLPRTPGIGADIDHVSQPDFFEAIAHGTSRPVEDVRRMGYAADEGYVYSRVAGTNPEWIVPLSANHRTSVPFCPSCLKADEAPYYRKRWRYAFAPVCPQHGLFFENCPACGVPYRGPSLSGPATGTESIGRCPHCLSQFRPITAHGLDDRALGHVIAAQDTVFSGLESGWVPVDGEPLVHICMYLRGLHDLIQLLINEKLGPQVSGWISKESGLPTPHWALGSFESQISIVRALALAQAAWLIGEWPHRMVAMAKKLNVNWSAIWYRKTAPGWLLHPDITQEFRAVPSTRSRGESEEARNLLRQRRNWAPNDAELHHFMRTGEVPPIRPLSRSVPDYVKRDVQEAEETTESIRRQQAEARKAGRTKPRELYPALGREDLEEEPLSDLDDATENLTSLTELRRKSRAKPTSG